MFSREQRSHSNTRRHRSPRPRDLGGFLLHLSAHAQAFVHSELCRPQPACDLGRDCPSLGLRLPSLPVNPEGGSLGRGVRSQICKGALCRDACGLSPVRSPLPALQTYPVRDPGAGAAGSATGPRVGRTPLQSPQDSWRVSHRPRRWRGAKPPETPERAGSLSAGLRDLTSPAFTLFAM